MGEINVSLIALTKNIGDLNKLSGVCSSVNTKTVSQSGDSKVIITVNEMLKEYDEIKRNMEQLISASAIFFKKLEHEMTEADKSAIKQ
ncbi:MAG: hypothetical protein ACI4II_01965 [Acutalibacteraceae bacterium]